MSTNPPSESLQTRIADWTHALQPRNPIEEFLAELAAGHAHNIKELERAAAARNAHHLRTAPVLEATRAHAEVVRFGRELIEPASDEWERRNQTWEGKSRPNPDPTPRPPELLVHLLEATADGCRWMADQWVDLSAILDEGLTWGNADERKAIRLLGKTPDNEDNAAVRELRVAHCVVTRQAPPHLGALTEETLGRPVPTKEEGKTMLQAICIRAIERLHSLAIRRDQQMAPTDPNEEVLRHSFDDSKEAKELRRQLSTEHRELLKSLEMLMKMKKQPENAEGSIDERWRKAPSSGSATFSHGYAGEGRLTKARDLSKASDDGPRPVRRERVTAPSGRVRVRSKLNPMPPTPSTPGDRGLSPVRGNEFPGGPGRTLPKSRTDGFRPEKRVSTDQGPADCSRMGRERERESH